VARKDVPVVMYTRLMRRLSPAILFYSLSAGGIWLLLDADRYLGECKKPLAYLTQLRIIIMININTANHHKKYLQHFIFNREAIFVYIRIYVKGNLYSQSI
jgi:hypothetical protein